MICKDQVKKYCSEDISLIENYSQAVADQEETWHCHHRRELSEQKSGNQLIVDGEYYGRPASELIFLTKSEHHRLHSKNQRPETLAKISAARKGKKCKPFSLEHKAKISAAKKGKQLSMEARQRISNATKGNKNPMFGKHHSIEAKQKIGANTSAANTGKKWFTNGIQSKFCKECPSGFVPGRHL